MIRGVKVRPIFNIMTKTDLRQSDITYVKGVGEYRAKLLHNLGIYTINDLFETFPKDYQAREVNVQIRHIQVGQFVSLKVTVFSVNEVTTRGGLKILKAVISDGDRMMECIWFTYGKWVTKLLTTGKSIWVYGKVGEYNGNLSLSHPQIEPATETETTNDFWKNRKVLPIYSLTASLTQNTMRNIVYHTFAQHHQDIEETLPTFLCERYGFLDRKTALQKMHFALSTEEIVKVKSRFIYEDFLYLQIMIEKNSRTKSNISKEKKHINHKNLTSRLYNNLPFTLTNSQKKVISEIVADMVADKPMNRLLQGDVGAGKTIVTVFAILLAIENGYQTAFIAPTEILAEQHYKSITKLLAGFDEVKICLLLGGKSKKKSADKMAIANGEINIAIGTHALIQKDVVFKNLSLVVIDEQHRFGVVQRSELSLRHHYPDLLYLSATPIPRSLAMTIFGDISISSITELPPTRKPVKTVLVHGNHKSQIYEEINEQIKQGRQVYIVCPLIEESEKVDLQDAESLHSAISQEIFPQYMSAILHGRMTQKEKEKAMTDFKDGTTQILVSTTVIEVGIDVPNASVMMIEHAERFGLAQLHQLRGRVGRGAEQSFCYLVAYAMSDVGRERLNTMVKTNDGFLIAEKDLQLRGPGDMFGTHQSGLPEFRFANLVTDTEWLHKAKLDAVDIVNDDPDLTLEENSILKKYYMNNVLKKESLSTF